MSMKGKRVLVTCADRYMGPANVAIFEREGAELITSTDRLLDQQAVDELLASAGEVDVVIANFAAPPKRAKVQAIADEDWQYLFDHLVMPLMRIVRGVMPQMVERRQGKVVAITSAAPLAGAPLLSAYAAARGAQNAFIRSIGLELARDNVQVNAVAQNYVKNDTYYSDEFIGTEKFADHVRRNVPIQRLAEGWESAELALFLASDRSDFIVGQIVPFAGGWTTTTG